MCGRFVITHPAAALAALFEAVPANDLPAVPRYNVCPTQRVAAVTAADGARRLVVLRWGFLPAWYKAPGDGPLLVNARAETVAARPAFRTAARERRCLIPADGFYEWQKAAGGERLPWFVTRRDGAPMAFGGLWQAWEGAGERLLACAIVTTPANAALAPVHDRMPLILEPADWPLWLGEAGHGAARLMRPADPERVALWRVGTAVNSSRAEGPDLVAPLAAPDHGLPPPCGRS
ncbi:MAG: SOS response-associated peptidase [Rhodobacteraceae bacterium]|nr:SOS response-associated peptidase [Paracoccaceae bacterium]